MVAFEELDFFADLLLCEVLAGHVVDVKSLTDCLDLVHGGHLHIEPPTAPVGAELEQLLKCFTRQEEVAEFGAMY